MNARTTEPRGGEQGSALILAVLITVILSLLGISYLLMAQTENVIAENERNAALALYVAESGARMAVNWLNDPSATGYLVPTTGQVVRSDRLLDHDDNPATARVLASSGDAAKPLYKDAALTASALFDRPYRSALADTFLGIETGTDADPNHAAKGPDLVVTQSHLDTINNALFPNFPSADLRARISRIEIYSPPIQNIGGASTRMGIATIKVIGGVFIHPGTTDERQIAARVVKAVVNEIPVPGPVGPLQSCATLAYNGEFSIKWGTGSSIGNSELPSNMDSKVETGLPYALNDPFTYINGANTLASWATFHNGSAIEDPWKKYISGGTIDSAPNGNVQPWPHAYPGTTTTDHSNVFQHTLVSCPTFDYNLWKSIAQSGSKNHFYYKWAGGGNFQLDGAGTPVSFVNATSGRTGVMFFDTVDSQVPRGLYTDSWPTTNLTDNISIDGATGWQGVQGFLFSNAKNFRTTGAGGLGTLRTVYPPGEPGDGSGFVNLQYPASVGGSYTIRTNANPQSWQDPSTGDWHCVDYTSCPSTPSAVPVQDPVGLPFRTTVIMDGVWYTSGTVTNQGNAIFFGSVVAEQGVLDGGGNPTYLFDESLIKGNWPRKGMNLPRVVVTAWQTDL